MLRIFGIFLFCVMVCAEYMFCVRAGWWANWAEYDKIRGVGEVSEWLKEHAWKACKVARPSQVRILFSPPGQNATHGGCFLALVQ